ncbi:MAG: O-antigen ligase family protein [Microcoleaceae cyanobacterium]
MIIHQQNYFNMQKSWQWIKKGIFLLPLLPNLGVILTLIGVFLSWKYRFKLIIKQPLNQALFILSGCLILTTILAQNPIEALLGLGNFIPYFIVFIALSEIIQTPTQLKQLSWIIIIPAIPIIILGLGQQFLGWSGGEQIQSILGWTLPLNGNPPGRMSSVFMYANILAAYLLLVFTLATGLLIEQLQIILKSKKIHSIKPFSFLILVFSLTAIALIITYSRNAWILVIFTIFIYAIYLSWKWLIGLILSAILAVLGAAFAPSPLSNSLRLIVPAYIWQRLTDQNFERPIETLRITQWKFAWNLTQQRPWTGWGLRSFTPIYEDKMNIWMGHPHNLFLMLTAETGLPITLFFIGIIGFILTKFAQTLITKNLKPADQLILFSYGLAFVVYTLFNLADVSLFDFRVNTFGWLILAGIWGNTRYMNYEL